jgi:ATP-binding cassette subfamily B protein
MGVMYGIGMKEMKNWYAAADKMNNTIVEYVNGMDVVKIFGRDGESYQRFEGDVKNYRDFTFAWYKACWPWMALYASILPCIALFTLPIGAGLVYSGVSTLPDFALILCMSFSVGPLFLKALTFMSTIPQINHKIIELEKTLNTSPLAQTNRPFSGRDHSIAFESVCFAYDEAEVLHDVSLHVSEGSLVALVGESGSGKSTLAKLLVHFYDVSGGAVKLGGQDIREMSIEALNDEISFVAQEQFLFNISLLENIRLGKPEASDEEVLSAAEKAQCNEFLGRLQQGIHTLAGDGGKQLSGGERQRISLARAILKNAPVIVLDEATAFMDPENEEKMNDAITELIENKTVIVIAHRLRSVMNADVIAVLDEGNLAAAGTHTELLTSCAAYQKLWSAHERSIAWAVNTEGSTVQWTVEGAASFASATSGSANARKQRQS